MSGLITKNELRKELRDEIESKASKQEVNNNTENISTLQAEVAAHLADDVKHLQAGERDDWNNKANADIREDTTKPLRTEVASSLPSSRPEGSIIFDKSSKKFKGHDGSKWV